jgi:hypothetical protein
MRPLALAALTALFACSSEVLLPGGGTPSTGISGGSGGGGSNVAGGSDPGCAVGGEGCDVDADCCSGWCGAGICAAGPHPTCTADGYGCNIDAECCTGVCTASTCSAPPACGQGSTKCVACVSQNCCPDVSACLADPVCAQGWACFDKCSQQGGLQLTCAQTCLAQFPSQAGQNLLGCGNAVCTSACL